MKAPLSILSQVKTSVKLATDRCPWITEFSHRSDNASDYSGGLFVHSMVVAPTDLTCGAICTKVDYSEPGEGKGQSDRAGGSMRRLFTRQRNSGGPYSDQQTGEQQTRAANAGKLVGTVNVLSHVVTEDLPTGVKLDKIKRSSTYSVIKREGPNMLRLLEFPGIGTGRVMKVDGDNSTEHLAERIARVEFVNDNAEVGDAEGGDAVKASVYMGNSLKKKRKAAKLAAKVEEQQKKKAENEKNKFLLVEWEKARADLLEEQKQNGTRCYCVARRKVATRTSWCRSGCITTCTYGTALAPRRRRPPAS